jgi:Tfp pilus assembly protein PilV
MRLFSPSVIRRSPARRAFTLLEVMIAVGILFMCLFGVLALLSNSLGSARKLQQHRTIDTDSVAGLIYAQLINTNQVAEGPVDVDLDEMYPGCKCDADLTQIATNGLCQVDFLVRRNQKLELQSHFLIYLSNLKQGGISASLPHH